jgi:Calcineurin-like phosphoesterase superfamily domain
VRIGLVTDIHNHAEELSHALKALQDHRVDRVITLGDTCDAFGRGAGAAEVTDLLRACGATGVWGNHDFGLCRAVNEATRRRYDPGVLEFMAGMEPWLEIGDCRVSHEEAFIDPYDVAQLWAVEEVPLDMEERARRSFAAAPQRCLFQGHHHRWFAATPQGRLDWEGERPLHFTRPNRYFVVMAPVISGWCAVYDTATSVLDPIQFAVGEI